MPKTFKQRCPDGRGDWIWNTKGVEKVLFRLPEITQDIAHGLPVFICEGEKDVLEMTKRGFSATCSPGGAGKWQDPYSETLRGADVIIVADKDKSGREHAHDVAFKLRAVAKFVRVIELPDINGKTVKDAADFFAAGGDIGQVHALVDCAPEWKTPVETPANPPETAPCRPLRVDPPAAPMDFEQWREVISANFPAYARPAEICASVFAQLLLNDVANPFALALVDVPSSGKTITLNFFDVKELAYTTDSFTPASFVSHASNVNRERTR